MKLLHRSATDLTQEKTTYCVLERNKVVVRLKAPRVFPTVYRFIGDFLPENNLLLFVRKINTISGVIVLTKLFP